MTGEAAGGTFRNIHEPFVRMYWTRREGPSGQRSPGILVYFTTADPKLSPGCPGWACVWRWGGRSDKGICPSISSLGLRHRDGKKREYIWRPV